MNPTDIGAGFCVLLLVVNLCLFIASLVGAPTPWARHAWAVGIGLTGVYAWFLTWVLRQPTGNSENLAWGQAALFLVSCFFLVPEVLALLAVPVIRSMRRVAGCQMIGVLCAYLCLC